MSAPNNFEPGRARHVTITLVTGSPIGLTIRRLANSDAVVLTCSRELLPRAWEEPETKRSGVYILLGIAPDNAGILAAYVGKATSIRDRIRQHCGRAFLQTAMLIAADDQLTDEQTSYIESRLATILESSRMVSIIGTRRPKVATIRGDLRDAAEKFLSDALLLLGPIEPMLALVATTASARRGRAEYPIESEVLRTRERSLGGELFEMRRGRAYALARRTRSGGLRVIAGSRLVKAIGPRLPKKWVALREQLLLSGGVAPTADADVVMLLRDADMPTKRSAACLVAGDLVNHSRMWRQIAPPTRASKAL
jgi:hypothetical protein